MPTKKTAATKPAAKAPAKTAPSKKAAPAPTAAKKVAVAKPLAKPLAAAKQASAKPAPRPTKVASPVKPLAPAKKATLAAPPKPAPKAGALKTAQRPIPKHAPETKPGKAAAKTKLWAPKNAAVKPAAKTAAKPEPGPKPAAASKPVVAPKPPKPAAPKPTAKPPKLAPVAAALAKPAPAKPLAVAAGRPQPITRAPAMPPPRLAPKPLAAPKPIPEPETAGEPQLVPAFKGRAGAAKGMVLVGAVAGAFGVKGEVRLRAFTARREGVISYGPLYGEDGKIVVKPKSWRELKDGVAVVAPEVKTREQAEKLRGVRLFVPRANLPPPDEDEFYIVDLLGCRAEALDGQVLGEVVAVWNFGAGDIIEYHPPNGGPNVRVTFTKETAPHVDLQGKRVVLDPPAPEPLGK